MTGQTGVWMLVCVAIAMIITGLPAWLLLIGISGAFSIAGALSGAISPSLLNALPARLIGLLESDILQALPLYVFMGVLLNRLPLAEAMFACGSRTLSRLGAARQLSGLGLGVLLAPMNGSVGASVAMLTRTVLPRLNAARGGPAKGAAIVCVASTLGVVIPPSLVLILLGDAMMRAHTEATNATHMAVRIINTQDIFRGAMIPAGMLVALALFVAWLNNRTDGQTQTEQASPSQWLTSVVSGLVILGLLGGVALGYLYAVEAAATGGLALLLLGIATRSLDRPLLAQVLRETMGISGALFALLVAATCFTFALRAFETDRWIASWLSGFGGNPQEAMAIVLAILLVSAFVLDAFEMIFVVIPILMPPLLVQVPDATWVAVIVLLILQLSFLLPPFGYAVMTLGSQIPRSIPIGSLSMALAPFVVAQLFVLAVVLARPEVVWHATDSVPIESSSRKVVSDDEFRKILEQQAADEKPETTNENAAGAK